MWRIAWSNLKHDLVRFATAVLGVSIAVALITIQGAILLGAIDSSALLVRTSAADLWIVSEHALNADFSLTMPDRRMYQALGVNGVAQAGRLLVRGSILRFPSGRQEFVVVVGVDANHDWLGLEAYRDHSFLSDRYLLLDRREEKRFGENGRALQVGDEAELNGYRVEVAGFVPGKSSFIATPYVFCGYEAGLNFTDTAAGQATFILVKCAPGVDVRAVQRELRQRLSDVDVWTRAEFAERSWKYWVLGTGMGMAIGLSTALAFAVGTVIVGQTIFTSVMARLREYATLKAVGFGNSFVVGTVLLQSMAVVVVGYPVGVGISLLLAHYAGQGGTAVVMRITPGLLAAMVPLAAGMCGVASVGAVAKVLRVAPARVFR